MNQVCPVYLLVIANNSIPHVERNKNSYGFPLFQSLAIGVKYRMCFYMEDSR